MWGKVPPALAKLKICSLAFHWYFGDRLTPSEAHIQTTNLQYCSRSTLHQFLMTPPIDTFALHQNASLASSPQNCMGTLSMTYTSIPYNFEQSGPTPDADSTFVVRPPPRKLADNSLASWVGGLMTTCGRHFAGGSRAESLLVLIRWSVSIRSHLFW